MFTDIFWRFLILETLVIGALSQICPHEHPQKRYCNNQFALKARVYGSPGNYNMSIQTLFKGNRSLLTHSSNRVPLSSPTYINFTHGNVFAIFGYARNGVLNINTCTGIHLWKFLQPFQKSALDFAYSTGCRCSGSIPSYALQHYCEWRHSYLKRVNRVCRWIQSYALRQCRINNAALIHRG